MPVRPVPSALAAVAAGLALAASAHAGEAGKQCSIAPINGCNLGWYCRIQPPITPAKLGYCARRPDSCPAAHDPVCGVNGETYANPCEASKDGENIDYAGPCRRAP